jgi:hypothetical protein
MTAASFPSLQDRGRHPRWPHIAAVLCGPLNIGLFFLYTALFPEAGSSLGTPVGIAGAVVELLLLAVVLHIWSRLTILTWLSLVALDVVATGLAIVVSLIIYFIVTPAQIDNS